MEDLRQRLADALDAQGQDVVKTLRLEVFYSTQNGQDLRGELEKLGTSYDRLFEQGIQGESGFFYDFEREGPFNGSIKRRLPHNQAQLPLSPPPLMMTFPPPPILFNTYCLQPQPLPRPAKVADIYDCCNELLSSSVYDEIPIDLLEEQVEDKLQEAGMTLPDVRRGTNFFDLVDRASNTHINGHLTNGRLCRNTGPPTFHPSGPVHSSHGPSYNEPPPPYRPPSAMLQFRQNMSAPALPQKDEGYLVDSSDEEQNSYPQTRHTAKISRFSVHGMNTDSSAPNLSRGMSNLNFHNMTPAEREEELKVRLVEKYCLKNEPHVAGNHEETLIQMAALRECQDRWGAAIRRMPEFLYLMKIWWLTGRHISLSDLDKDFLDRIVDPKGKSQLEWRLFGVYVDDLIQLEILVLAPKTEQNDQGDRLTVNRCIQLLNLFPFDHNGLAQKVYAHLEYETETGIASIEQLSRKFGRSRDDICDRVLQYAEVMSIQFESNSVKLNPQLPFFVLLNH